MRNSKIINKIQLLRFFKMYLLYGMVITIIFSRLNLNSYCLILFTLAWLIEGQFKTKWALLKEDKLVIAYMLYFLIQFTGMAQSANLYNGWKGVEDKLGFLFLPMVFCSAPFLNIKMRRNVMLVWSLSVTLASIYCLAIA